MSRSQPLAFVFCLFSCYFAGLLPSLETSRSSKALAPLRKMHSHRDYRGQGRCRSYFSISGLTATSRGQADNATAALCKHHLTCDDESKRFQQLWERRCDVCDLPSAVAAAANGVSQALHGVGVTTNVLNLSVSNRSSPTSGPLCLLEARNGVREPDEAARLHFSMQTSVTGVILMTSCNE